MVYCLRVNRIVKRSEMMNLVDMHCLTATGLTCSFRVKNFFNSRERFENSKIKFESTSRSRLVTILRILRHFINLYSNFCYFHDFRVFNSHRI